MFTASGPAYSSLAGLASNTQVDPFRAKIYSHDGFSKVSLYGTYEKPSYE
jgi:hypothetical protein